MGTSIGSLSDWSYQLTGGASPNYGVLEITYKGTPGYACTYGMGFNASDLHRICNKVLGLGLVHLYLCLTRQICTVYATRVLDQG